LPELISEYDPESTREALKVLMDLFARLAGYRRHAVVVGGWVPYLTCPNAERLHCGSKDIDIAFDSEKVGKTSYEELAKVLKSMNFVERRDRNKKIIEFSYERAIKVGGRELKIHLDLLAQYYGGRGKKHATQIVKGQRARKAMGADLALEDPVEFDLDGEMPGGAKNRVKIRVAKPMPHIVMKAHALDSRAKEKDAYDIYWICKYHPDGRAAIATAFRRKAKDQSVIRAIAFLEEKFGGMDRLGPSHVADFLETEVGNRDIVLRDAYETVQDLLRRVRGDSAR